MNITVIGGGFVGVTTATVFAEADHDVRLVEKHPERLQLLSDGTVPFFEPGLAEAFANMLRSGSLTVGPTVPEARPDLVFLCVGTPALQDGATDLEQVRSAARELGARGPDWGPGRTVVVVKSTVPPKTTNEVVRPLLAPSGCFAVAMNPEFLREGSALADARAPDRIVIGTSDSAAEETLLRLYSDATCPVQVTTTETAELTKYATNAMLAIRVSYANEISRLAENVGCDVDEVMGLVGLDPRIGPHFLKAGPGFGGSCFPKDVRSLTHVAASAGCKTPLLDAALKTNEEQPLHIVQTLDRLIGGLQGKKIALLGLAFKANTSDVRETRSLVVHQALMASGATVICHDPMAAEGFLQMVPEADVVGSAGEALRGADAAIVMTEWQEYAELGAEDLLSMNSPLVYDTRRILDRERLEKDGIRLASLGDATVRPSLKSLEVQR